ncbi:MAG: CRISPR-associated endonuclease Cas1 [Acidimicrobiales bacterium]
MPELVPVRMLNEFVYCERLFFIEWVQARWAGNEDTAEGDYAHRSTDRQVGSAPPPDSIDELRIARSVKLSSERLGLVGVIDTLEGNDGGVVPIDYKKGAPPDTPAGAWEPERVQLCALGLLLRDNGYECSHGEIYFAQTRQRVRVEFDERLVEVTLDLLTQLRATAAADNAPGPLDDSPKCPRCSLVGVCLPDETNKLNRAQVPAPVRLMVRNGDSRPVYATEPGSTVGKSGERLIITNRDRDGSRSRSVRLIDVSQLNVFGNVQVTTQAIRELMRRDIPICWFSHGGWFSGIAEGLPSKHVDLRVRQASIAADGNLDLARASVLAKIKNSRALLMRNARPRPHEAIVRLKSAVAEAQHATSVPSLLGVEGAAARTYWSHFGRMLRPNDDEIADFDMNGRNRRPPLDRVNCLLSYCYSLLVKDCTAMAFSVGLDPYMGYYHRPRFGRPALALDLSEEFRPLIAESTVLTLINNGEVAANDFVVRAQGVALTQDGRRAVLRAYERRLETELTHPVFGYRVSYRRAIELQARLVAAVILGEVPAYEGLTMR